MKKSSWVSWSWTTWYDDGQSVPRWYWWVEWNYPAITRIVWLEPKTTLPVDWNKRKLDGDDIEDVLWRCGCLSTLRFNLILRVNRTPTMLSNVTLKRDGLTVRLISIEYEERVALQHRWGFSILISITSKTSFINRSMPNCKFLFGFPINFRKFGPVPILNPEQASSRWLVSYVLVYGKVLIGGMTNRLYPLLGDSCLSILLQKNFLYEDGHDRAGAKAYVLHWMEWFRQTAYYTYGSKDTLWHYWWW